MHFNPRSPHGERRMVLTNMSNKIEFQSTLPARGATSLLKIPNNCIIISIHAPRTGSDRYKV